MQDRDGDGRWREMWLGVPRGGRKGIGLEVAVGEPTTSCHLLQSPNQDTRALKH